MFKLNKNEKNNTIRRPFTSIANIYVYYSISDETSNMLRCLKITLRNFASELSFSRKKKKKNEVSSWTTKEEIFYLIALRLINKVAGRGEERYRRV